MAVAIQARVLSRQLDRGQRSEQGTQMIVLMPRKISSHGAEQIENGQVIQNVDSPKPHDLARGPSKKAKKEEWGVQSSERKCPS